jgi:hypothetical protein
MANTPKKAQDPAEAALAAIQDALNLASEDQAKAGTRTGGRDGASRASSEAMRVDEDLFADARRSDQVVSPSQPPANDDRRDLAQMLERLSRRPSTAPLVDGRPPLHRLARRRSRRRVPASTAPPCPTRWRRRP